MQKVVTGRCLINENDVGDIHQQVNNFSIRQKLQMKTEPLREGIKILFGANPMQFQEVEKLIRNGELELAATVAK